MNDHPNTASDEIASAQSSAELADLFNNGPEVDRRVLATVRAAVKGHIRAGDPISTWRDGEVVIIPADQVELPKLSDDQAG